MVSLHFIRCHCRKISLGETVSERVNRALTHFFMLLVDKKVEWHCRGIWREVWFHRA
ncbi:MAG: hypothetical protein V1913_03415 [Fibrobacterota bacterium]